MVIAALWQLSLLGIIWSVGAKPPDIVARSKGRLADWSFAGYRGQLRIPSPPVVTNVKDYGARGNGVTDDTAAIRRALAAAVKAGGGAVFLPAGRYVISERISITNSSIVLRGAGPDATVLLANEPLNVSDGISIFNKQGNGASTLSPYSWWDGYLTIRGPDSASNDRTNLVDLPYRPRGELVMRIMENTRAMSTYFVVNSTKGIAVGDIVRLFMSDPSKNKRLVGTLADAMYDYRLNSECPSCGVGLRGMRDLVRFPSRVMGVGPNFVILERRVPWQVRTEWYPHLRVYPAGTPMDSGIESLALQFPWTPSAIHHEELGFNGIYLTNVVNCWVRDVRIRNSDSGVLLGNADFVTVQDVRLEVSKDRRNAANPTDGHIGLGVNWGNDVLFQDFVMDQTFLHDTTVRSSAHVVFHRGSGRDIAMDCHRTAPWATLWSSINLGEGRRVYSTGGALSQGMACGGRTTYYNITKSGTFPRLPPATSAGKCTFGTTLNFLGNFAATPESTCPLYWIYSPTAAEYSKLRLPQASTSIGLRQAPAH